MIVKNFRISLYLVRTQINQVQQYKRPYLTSVPSSYKARVV